eukprot:759394-Hanusia_phi.AAC.3
MGVRIGDKVGRGRSKGKENMEVENKGTGGGDEEVQQIPAAGLIERSELNDSERRKGRRVDNREQANGCLNKESKLEEQGTTLS